MQRLRIFAAFACCFAVFGLAACSSSSSKGAPAGGSATITIKSFAFTVASPVKPGAKVTVENDDSTDHTVSALDGSFDVRVHQGARETFTAPSKPGSYQFRCNIHTTMHGTLTVN